MDNKPFSFFFVKSLIYTMPALFYYSASALAAISPYYTSYFKDTLHSFVLAASSIIKMITFPLSSLVSF